MKIFFFALFGFAIDTLENSVVAVCKWLLRPFAFKVVPENYAELLEAENDDLTRRLDFLCNEAKASAKRLKPITDKYLNDPQFKKCNHQKIQPIQLKTKESF